MEQPASSPSRSTLGTPASRPPSQGFRVPAKGGDNKIESTSGVSTSGGSRGPSRLGNRSRGAAGSLPGASNASQAVLEPVIELAPLAEAKPANKESKARPNPYEEEEKEESRATAALPDRFRDLPTVEKIPNKPDALMFKELSACLRAPLGKIRMAAVDRVGDYCRHYFDDMANAGTLHQLLQIFEKEPAKTPLARSIVAAIACMSIQPGARTVVAPYTPYVIAVLNTGNKSIREKGCLAVMNLAADETCRNVLLECGATEYLLSSLASAVENEEVGAKYAEHATGGLCNIVNGGPEFQQAIFAAGGVDVLVNLVAIGVDNISTQRSALILQHLKAQPEMEKAILAKADKAGILKPATPPGKRGRGRMHPMKLVASPEGSA